MHLVYIPLNMDSVYHMWKILSLGSLPLKVRFIPLEAYMDTEVTALRRE